MKTCIYCGRTYQEDVRICPACGLNLEQAPENIMGAIEIDVEPEEWIAPHQQTQQTKTQHIRQEQEAPLPLREEPQPARQVSDEPERGAAETLSPERMRMFRGNQYFYVFRMLLLTVPGGTGSGSLTIYGDGMHSIGWIALVPTIDGNYSYSWSLYLTDVQES